MPTSAPSSPARGRRAALLLLLSLALCTLPWLGLTDFNTKGEPREAVVAWSMLDSGNWTLAYTNGGEMAYKPPFLHWCIAALTAVRAVLTGQGDAPAVALDEYMSRLPSALAAVAMLMACFAVFRRPDATAGLAASGRRALFAVVLLFTSFEVHRAAFACRVDMVLTACMVGALLCLYLASGGLRRTTHYYIYSAAAVLLMSLGTLTTGPVAIVLPCGAAGLYLWLRGHGLWRTAGRMALLAAAACVLPALWYWAAWREGGDAFLALVREENVDRFLGKMSYESHVNPWWYNVQTLLAGFLPWTLAALFVLVGRWCGGGRAAAHGAKPSPSGGEPLRPAQGRPLAMAGARRAGSAFPGRVRALATRTMDRLRTGDALTVFSAVVAAEIFVFYCIPSSKRSVYLLPCYPFVAWLLAGWLLRLWDAGRRSLRVYGHVVAGLSIALFLVLVAVRAGWVPDSQFRGRHAAESVAMLHALRAASWLRAVVTVVPLAAVYLWFTSRSLRSLCAVVVTLFLALDAFYQPVVLNTKSDRAEAEAIAAIVPAGQRIDSFIDAPLMHFYTVNFYLGDRIGTFDPATATEGWLLVGDRDAGTFLPEHAAAFLFSEPYYVSPKRSCDTKQRITLYRYCRK